MPRAAGPSGDAALPARCFCVYVCVIICSGWIYQAHRRLVPQGDMALPANCVFMCVCACVCVCVCVACVRMCMCV